jgi:hypothetical protein
MRNDRLSDRVQRIGIRSSEQERRDLKAAFEG